MVAQALPLQGVLRVVPPATLEAALQKEAAAKWQQNQPTQPEWDRLAQFIHSQYDMMRRHRDMVDSGWSQRLLDALMAFNGRYSASKLAEIQKFGGSTVYARIIAMKSRGATALLRDVYLAPDRPWAIEPPSDPDVPAAIVGVIRQLVEMEVMDVVQAGQPPPPAEAIRDRVTLLMNEARAAEKRRAAHRAELANNKIEELLNEGGFYKALAEFLVDLPLFPYACIKGPTVRIVPSVVYNNGQATVTQSPRMFWNRISPFDLYWTPGVSDIEDAAVVERVKFTRGDLNDLLDLPGYNHDAIRDILEEFGRGGLSDDQDSIETQRATFENRENPHFNKSGMIYGMEFHGNVQGSMLLEYGFSAEQIPDPVRDYMVQAWKIGRRIIKVQLSPSPRKRHPYFVSSFEKVPGTPVGNGLPDILADIQDVCNATLRALVNNLSIASGPQVEVNDDRLANDEDGNDLFPWKRWHTTSSQYGNNSDPAIRFFQPESNASELLAVYREFNNIADDLSAIPKYQTGSGATGGAGRTASGLAMLMGNASKLLQTVAANIDRDVIGPALDGLFDLLMLTDTSGVLQGDEAIKVMGVNVAQQRETMRSRQLEFLQITANPIDAPILGARGRANVLRQVANTIGLDGETVVPSDERIAALEAIPPEAQVEGGAAAAGQQEGPTTTNDGGPRTRIAGGVG